MPKSITREYDKSKRVLNLSANFAVFVPGFASTDETVNGALKAGKDPVEEAKKAGIYFADTNIYKLDSVKDFEYYIGKKNTNDEIVTATEAIVEVADSTQSGPNRYIRTNLTLSELVTFDQTEYKYYTLIETTTTQPTDWATKRRLWSTITVEDQASELSPKPTITTYYHFAEFEKAELVAQINAGTIYRDGGDIMIIKGGNTEVLQLVKILVGNEGTDVRDNSTRHLGNRIAYELLKVGYTVFYRVLDASKSVLEQLREADFWAPLKDKSTYRIRYLTTGGCYNYSVYQLMEDVATFNNNTKLAVADTLMSNNGRGECIALLDIDESTFDATYKTPAELAHAFGTSMLEMGINDGKNCAVFAPRVVYYDTADDIYNPGGTLDVKFPASFNYLLCMAKSQESFAEWWAAAGYQRGVSNKTIKYTTYNFGDLLINTLAPREKNTYTERAINLILNERGNYYLWGNRTAYKIEDTLKFSHFLNIRQLCTTLKQVIYEATRQYTFDPNSDILWINFVNAIRPTLERMKGDQGIKGYRISRVDTEEKAVLKAVIRIVPIEAVEDFDISIYLEDSVDGINVEADESEAK